MQQSVPNVSMASLSVELQQLTLQLQEVRADNQFLAQALVEQKDSERQQLGQTLHDDLGQYVVGIRAQIQLLQMVAEQPQTVCNVAQLLEQHANHLQQGFQCLVQDLYPVKLEHFSVAQLLHSVQKQWQQLHGGQCTLHILAAPPQLSLAHKQQLYRVLQEVLTNAQRHGLATHVHIWLQYKQQAWRLLMRDNGSGGAQPRHGVGLHSMTARASALNAQLHIQARSARGWSIYLCAPVRSENNENTLG